LVRALVCGTRGRGFDPLPPYFFGCIMTEGRIKPRVLRGFQDFLPLRARKRQSVADAFRAVFESYGFAPLDTPALETEEVLLADYGVDSNKQIYRFTDLDNIAIGLRFDFTVSLARVVASSLNEIQLPFKRYQSGPVWRFDKPKRGRYREFMQMDIDVIGAGPYEPEVELVAALNRGFTRLGLNNCRFRINDRSYLGGILRSLEISSDKEKDVYRVLDKLAKQGEAKVRAELTGKMLLQDFESALEFERMQEVAIPEAAADILLAAIKDSSALESALSALFNRLAQEGVDPARIIPDPSLTRGLDYYTGFVCEIFIEGAEAVGSVGGGGRYDNLVSRYSGTAVTGVGLSVGVDRLLDAMELLGLDGGVRAVQSTAQVLVTVFDDALVDRTAAIARTLRDAGIAVELWLKSGNKRGRTLTKQFKYADKVGISLAVVAGEDELAADPPVVQLKDLRTEFGEEGKQVAVPLSELVARVRELLDA
jgi:histidyl-tRNA synthetase